MGRKPRAPLADRVASAAEASLAHQAHVSFVDILLRIGWLDPGALKRWRYGGIDCLEGAMQVGAPRLAEAMALFQSWAEGKRMLPSMADHVARPPHTGPLRFSRSGDPDLERRYRTYWMSATLPERKRERVAEKAGRAPDLLVIQPLNETWSCHRCGGTGDLLVMENPGPACLGCLGLADLEFLPAGDALLTRRAKAKSARHAVVVRFSRTRRRYERQGLLVEPQALAAARAEIPQPG
jgi:hypothetical protein